jgi:hypothetical protein
MDIAISKIITPNMPTIFAPMDILIAMCEALSSEDGAKLLYASAYSMD